MKRFGWVLKIFIIMPVMFLGWLCAMIKMSFKTGYNIYMDELKHNVAISSFFKQGDVN